MPWQTRLGRKTRQGKLGTLTDLLKRIRASGVLVGLSAGLAAGVAAVAPVAAVESAASVPLPTIQLGPHTVTRLILGGNSIYSRPLRFLPSLCGQ